jgi:serine/threonine protein kinase
MEGGPVALSAGTRLGPYEVAEPLGAGGMGEVYRARDPRLGRDVAIKVPPDDIAADPNRLRRFEHEAKAVAALNLELPRFRGRVSAWEAGLLIRLSKRTGES